METRLDFVSGRAAKTLWRTWFVPIAVDPGGPAENALVLVEECSGGRYRARYISWIGYYDVDEALRQEPGVWRLVEPPVQYSQEVEWMPFGWKGMLEIPNH